MSKKRTADELIRALASKGLARAVTVGAIDEEARTVELAFSSETAVERWFGEEVLDHSPGSVRLERLSAGGAALMDHNWRDQVGVVESVSIDADRIGRAVVRFGRGTRASEIFQDVIDGIRRHVSVGYSIHRVEITERKGQPDLVRVLDWEPHEISFVSVPADISVGVGRSLDNPPEAEPATHSQTDDAQQKPSRDEARKQTMNEKILRDASGNLVRAKVDDDGNIVETLEVLEKAGAAQRHGSDAERARVRLILEMGEQYQAADLARDAVKAGKTAEEFQRDLLQHLSKDRQPVGEERGADIGLTDKEAGNFSFMKALRALANPNDAQLQRAAAFEFEASRAAAQRYGKTAQGIMIPADVLRRALNTSTSGAAAGDTGGYAIDNTLLTSSFIDLLRNRNAIMRLGMTMGGLVGNVDIPRQTAGATGYWLGEAGDAGEGNVTLAQIGLTPKTVGAFSEITRKLLQQSSLDAEALVRRDLASALASTIDLAGYYGSGSANQPRGIANTTGVNAVDFAAVNPTYAELVQMESEIAADNADVNAMAYVLNARMRGHLKTAQKFSGTNGATVWEPGNMVNGYRAEVTNQIANGDVIFGNFADLIIGLWGGLDLTIDPYSKSKSGTLRIVVFQDVDFILRRVESFCVGRKPV